MDRLRRTMLYVPGNSASMIADAHIYGADSIMFDLEDAISITEKDAARLLVYHGLTSLPKINCEVVVRINGLDTPFGEEDIKYMVAAGVDVIRLPKTETAQDIIDVEALIEREEKVNNKPPGSVKMMAAIESPLGVVHAYEIAKASNRLIGIALGAEDYVTNLKTKRSPGGIELLHARSQILNAARACGIAALDTVYSDLDNMDGFKTEVELIHQLGFDGKSVINPRQIDIVHEVYQPTAKEIDYAKEIEKEAEKASLEGLGVFTVRGKMVDKPIIDRALRILQLAGATKVVDND
ncbi:MULTISPECIES: aldolase/citrate lyase family protein [unclassified Fusibacter]|uniref:aldolase/citrate lyase family protein n=1 Tax=unclassified Fusibacter TaxID=2624464 RepID=UPI001010F364|nr:MULTISPECIES: aldolase/citrate lyase family protein [unclassified Fusibacter]MCK8058596.1 aldolase/citrate lyase family protein [Fusibacter sp. A2]NPE22634.1 HpcH/HpaI aldolase/citrate lyase family protein [Fusibacter sp. A1]RXV60198.1 citrate lyase subunit beta [Fusibacter sp. A1]